MDREAKILVVDDDIVICNILHRYLSSAGYQVKTANSGDEMHRYIKLMTPDLIILDLQMPGKHGLELTQELRKDSNMGIIILTGSEEAIDKIVGLEIGADDYISKPCDERELLARVRSVLRRVMATTDQPADASVATFSGWTLDLTAHELRSPDGEEVRLTSYEFQLLVSLVQHPNRVLSRDQLMEHITGQDWVPSNRNVDVLMGKLRKKIEVDPHNPTLIKTIRSAGYKFTARVEYA